ncbi:MAG: hypothetical protein V2A56_09320 [bacterium]
MKYVKVILVFSLLVAFGTGSATAQFVPVGFNQHIHAAQMGMGGLTTVVASNAHTVIYNPGMLTRQPFAFEVTVPVGGDNTIGDLLTFVNDHQSDFQNFESLDPYAQTAFLKDSESFDNKWFAIQGAPFVGLSFKNFGLAAYTSVNAQTKIDQGVLVPAVGVRGVMDMVVAAGLSRTMQFGRKDVGVGAAFRFFQRYNLTTQRISATDAANFTDLMMAAYDKMKEPVTGFGIDLGAVHNIDVGQAGGPNLDVAAVIQDLYGSIDGEWVKPDLKFGAMYHLIDKGFLIRRLDLGMEFTDVLNRAGVSFWQKINMGGQLGILGGLLTARGGFHQGYPTLGLGIRFLFFKLDVAHYTRELGTSPGQYPEDMWIGQFSFGW